MSCPQNPSAERAKAYTRSGVNINAGYALVSRIKKLVKLTRTPGVISDIGGFGGLFKPDLSGMESPVLVGATDGVGTKLKLAFAFNRHSTVGIDLVAMSVNDVIVQGAKPLFFLDYFACGKLDAAVAETVIAGVAEGCRQAGCALLGGETAEMPGMYPEGEYDLAGFCVGLADQAKLADGSSIRAGDAVIGLASSGLHSNGYSLVRELFAKSGLGADDDFPGLPGQSAAETLLQPTLIYVEAILDLMRDFTIKGMANITGGGFFENIPRTLPGRMAAHIDFNSWPKSPLFNWLKEAGKLSWPEMLQIFNCGIGYVLVAPGREAGKIVARLSALRREAWIIGSIQESAAPEQVSERTEQVVINFD
jgi:phosphoribosylformylglycinamidine cyclo-ligase